MGVDDRLALSVAVCNYTPGHIHTPALGADSLFEIKAAETFVLQKQSVNLLCPQAVRRESGKGDTAQISKVGGSQTRPRVRT